MALRHPPEPASPVLLLPALPEAHHAAPWLANWVKAGEAELQGYQVWAVEQRITDRSAALPVIVVLTGDQTDTIAVDRFELSRARSLHHDQRESLWEETRQVLKHSGVRVNEILQGHLPVTALSSLPPSLSLVHIPGGDYREVVLQLYQNINLRRLGLGGRSGLRLANATPAQQLHFRQSFRLPIPPPSAHQSPGSSPFLSPKMTLTHISTSNPTPSAAPDSPASPSTSVSPFTYTVLSIIQLVQHALSLFGLGPVKSYLSPSLLSQLALESCHPPNALTHEKLEENLLDALSTNSDLDLDEWAEALGIDAHASVAAPILLEGDGLLCDLTVSALSLFRTEFAEPAGLAGGAMRADEAVLSPSLLSALLSLAIGARGKMLALGANHVPKDPFERRGKFLMSVWLFQRAHRDCPQSLPPVLTPSFLSYLVHLYTSKHPHKHHSPNHPNAQPSHSRVSRVLRSGLDAGLTTLASVGHHVDSEDNGASSGGTGVLGRHRLKGEDAETGDLERLIGENFERGVGGRTVRVLWGLREGKEGKEKDRRGKRREQEREEKLGEREDDGKTMSEGESAGGGVGVRGVLRGVKARAGRAGRKFGDGLGFTEAGSPSLPPTSPGANDKEKLAPTVLISPDSRDLSPARRESALTEFQPSVPATSATGSKAATFAARLASALVPSPSFSSPSGSPSPGHTHTTSHSQAGLPSSRRSSASRSLISRSPRLSPSPSIRSSPRLAELGLGSPPSIGAAQDKDRRSSLLPPGQIDSNPSGSGNALGSKPRRPSATSGPRRVVSDTYAALRRRSLEQEEETREEDREEARLGSSSDEESLARRERVGEGEGDREGEGEGGALTSQRNRTRSPTPNVWAGSGRLPLRRRHSFNIVEDAPEPVVVLSRRRLEMDVNLRMTAWGLHQREKQLSDMVTALQAVNHSYTQAISSLSAPLSARTAHLATLTTSAQSLTARVSSYADATSSISKLSTGASRLQYAQSVLEDKLHDITDFERMIAAKVGNGGTLEVATWALARERVGMRKLVLALEKWADWGRYLCGRVRWHCRWSRGEKADE
ncbi:hypothetical protein JCM21900_002974 [Sporobolomyces salmonicolor]